MPYLQIITLNLNRNMFKLAFWKIWY